MKINENYLARCAKIETNSIAAFKSFLKNILWQFGSETDAKTDMEKHIDCYVYGIAGAKTSVDIKGLKREISQGRVLVELQNVQGRRGWLFGQADLIAFQISDYDFLMVPRNALFKLAKSVCGFDVFTKGNFTVVMKGQQVSDINACNGTSWYCRPDRPKEKVVFLPLEEIKKIALTV